MAKLLETLSAGLQQLNIILPETAKQQLLTYLALLEKWNKAYNLTAVTDTEEMITLHLLDSLAVLPYLYPSRLDLQLGAFDASQRSVYPIHDGGELSKSNNAADSISRGITDASPILDVGTGAGLPGLVWAIARPNQSFYLLDSLGKRTIFLEKVVRDLQLENVTVIHARVEKYQPEIIFGVITSRALSTLKLFVDNTRHLSDGETCYLALKGRYPQDEIDAIQSNLAHYEVKNLIIPQLDAERHLVIFTLKK